jgi:hypothetical protein
MVTHYKEMKDELEKRKPDTDRVNLVYKMLNKINVQFDSGNDFYIFGKNGGAERVCTLVDEILHHDFYYARACVSGYCTYCPVKDMCKETVMTI